MSKNNYLLVRFLRVCENMQKRTTVRGQEFLEHCQTCPVCGKHLLDYLKPKEAKKKT